MERCSGQGMGKGRGASMFSDPTTLPQSPRVHQPGSSPNLDLLEFL